AESARTKRAVLSVLPSFTTTSSKGMAAARKVQSRADKVSSTAASSLRAGMITDSFTFGPPQYGNSLPCVALRQFTTLEASNIRQNALPRLHEVVRLQVATNRTALPPSSASKRSR